MASPFRPFSRHRFDEPYPTPVEFYHVLGPPCDSICSELELRGFRGVADQEAAFSALRADDFIADFPRNRRGGLRAMAANDGTTLLLREAASPWVATNGSAETELIAFRRGPDRLSAIADLPGINCGSTRYCRNRDWLQEKLTGLSVNGKLLLERSNQQACRDCYTDELRDQVRSKTRLDPSLVTAVRQGLWLEHLVADVCLQFTDDVWVGQMAELFELDVVANVAGQTLLFECKDSGLGQNDFFVALKKAHNLHADLLVLVSTQPFHANVQKAIRDELDRAEEDGDSVVIPVVWLHAPEAEAIANSLGGFLRDVRWLTIYHWLYNDHTSAAASQFFDVTPLSADA